MTATKRSNSRAKLIGVLAFEVVVAGNDDYIHVLTDFGEHFHRGIENRRRNTAAHMKQVTRNKQRLTASGVNGLSRPLNFSKNDAETTIHAIR